MVFTFYNRENHDGTNVLPSLTGRVFLIQSTRWRTKSKKKSPSGTLYREDCNSHYSSYENLFTGECAIQYSKMRWLYNMRMEHLFTIAAFSWNWNWKGWKWMAEIFFYWGIYVVYDRCNWAFPKSCNLPDDFVRNFDEKAESLTAANLEPVCDFVAKILCSRGGVHLEGLKYQKLITKSKTEMGFRTYYYDRNLNYCIYYVNLLFRWCF